ncbi:hypothetical protein A33M_1836 [Rhodovulum sp. PH10]|nr:hypothetical protein A33M_1836 [Rhodovulum sp. PH10]
MPLAPLSMALKILVRSAVHRHPAMFARLGDQAGKRFVIDPTDLPFVVVMTPRLDDPEIEAVRRGEEPAADARIAGPLAGLVGLVHGNYDGDALFFSRDLSVEGDMSAVVALRNALDDAEIDLVAEAAAVLGPLANPAERVGRIAAGVAERITGIAFARTRSEP